MSYYRPIPQRLKKQRNNRMRKEKEKLRRKNRRMKVYYRNYLQISINEYDKMSIEQKLNFFHKVVCAHDDSLKRQYSRKVVCPMYLDVCKTKNTFTSFNASGSGLCTNWILFHSKTGLVYELSKTIYYDEDIYKFESCQIDPNNPYDHF